MQVNAVIDIGNTRIKLGFFADGKLNDTKVANNAKEASNLLRKDPIGNLIVSSVRSDNEWVKKIKIDGTSIFLSSETPLPIEVSYQTKNTLGMDRLAAAAGAQLRYPGLHCLVIDMGTCITYDYLDETGNFQGGAISPGIRMRFQSLHQLTAKLPLIETWEQEVPLTGKSTKESIVSGVVMGVKQEIEGFIRSYHDKVANLQVIFTGGDFRMVENLLGKGQNWVSHLVLEGLNAILEYNISENQS